jgi:hypothetical protein
MSKAVVLIVWLVLWAAVEILDDDGRGVIVPMSVGLTLWACWDWL